MSPGLEFVPVDACLLCGETSSHPVKGVSWKGVAFSYSLCARCGLKFMNPRPTPESYRRFFRDEYWQMNLAGAGYPSVAGYDDARIDQMALRMPKYERGYRRVRKKVLEHVTLGPRTRVLEVGCGFGYTLEWLRRDFGCQVEGVEPSTEAVERCRRGGVAIVAATAEDYLSDEPPREGPYDVILFRHCLETLLDPRPVLRGVRNRLRQPSGILLVYTANVEYYDAMSPYAPFIFSPETLSRLARTCGLEVRSVVAPPSPVDHDVAVRVARPGHEFVLTAVWSELRPVEHPRVDPQAVARTINHGNLCRAWSELSYRDLLIRFGQKAVARVRGR